MSILNFVLRYVWPFSIHLQTLNWMLCTLAVFLATSHCQSGDEDLTPSAGNCPPQFPYLYAQSLAQTSKTNITVNVDLREGENHPSLFNYITYESPTWRAQTPTDTDDQQACDGPLVHRPSSTDVLSNLKCPWIYRCDYNPRRFPAYILHAQCKFSHWNESSSSEPQPCRPVYYPIPVLKTDTGCNHLSSEAQWKWTQETVAVGCTAAFSDLSTYRK